MGKAQRLKEQSVRERIAVQRAAAQRAETRRRVLIIGGSISLVVVIVVALVLVKISSGSSTPEASSGSQALPAGVTAKVTGVPASALNSVGAGSVLSYNKTPVTPGTGSALTSGGKPEMLYIGAEFCPYCAAMRWSMAVALSRFGSFTTPLRGIHSSPTDAYANTATLTFYKAGYTSKYLTFVPVEVQKVDRTALQNPTKEQNAIWARYEPGEQGYPFIDFGNKAVIKLPIYNPKVLAKMSWAQIASVLHDPASKAAAGVLGAANYMTAAICKMTSNQPSAVCSAPAITRIGSSF